MTKEKITKYIEEKNWADAKQAINEYLENNQIDISDSIPTEGNHVVGDIVIKETQVEHMAIGWICIEAGNPGVWSEFGGILTEGIKPDS